MALAYSNDGWRHLANAIIFQAIKDFQTGNPGRKSEVAKFLKTVWCDTLLPEGVSGKDIRKRIKEIKVPPEGDF